MREGATNLDLDHDLVLDRRITGLDSDLDLDLDRLEGTINMSAKEGVTETSDLDPHVAT